MGLWCHCTLSLEFNDLELELLLFPDLFPDGKGHYYELTKVPALMKIK